MTFKQNLLAKMEIDRMVAKISASIGPVDSGIKIDKETLRRLLEKSPYTYHRERDLDLYIYKTGDGESRILVLDNELPLYKTTVEDVVLRRSPTVKEMLSIRNAIKILKDSDVLVSKKQASLKTLRVECLALLDLSFELSDIEEIEKDAIASLGRGYSEGIAEALSLYAELLNFYPVPRKFQLLHHDIYVKIQKNEKGQYVFGPVVMYNKIDNSMKYVENEISGADREIIERLNSISAGKEKAFIEGSDVFKYLTRAIDFDNPLTAESEPIR
jgi:hypothetical protein